jgi:hypothetical protein
MSSVSNVTAGPAPVQAIAPSQAIINDANRIEYVTDRLGRRLGVKRVSASLRRKVLKALSAESGEKGQLFVMAATACCCVDIDGVPVPFPTTELQIDALVDRLEQEGLDAVATTLATKFSPPQAEDDLKNS